MIARTNPVNEVEFGFRIDLPVVNGESERYVFQFQDFRDRLELVSVSGEKTRSIPYTRMRGGYEPIMGISGERFERGSLEHTAFESMDRFKREYKERCRA